MYHISIDYCGAFAVCKVSGVDEQGVPFNNKNFNECDTLTKAMVLGAFDTIKHHHKRESRQNKQNG